MSAGPALVVAESGGPTAVMNASLVGAIGVAQARGARVLGARFGVEGILRRDYVDLTELTPQKLAILRATPGAALGSSRYRPTDDEVERLARELPSEGVDGITMVGGNDTADTLHRLDQGARRQGSSLCVVGIPKTIDNDLPGMDHCPGYGSAARYLALAVREAGVDTGAMQRTDPVKIVEVMGRDAGWLAAAAALGRERPRDPPQLIFLPERPRPLAQMIDEIREAQAALGWAVVVISENQRDDSGAPLGGRASVYTDPHGHVYFDSPGAYLARFVQSTLGLRARYERPGSLQRTAAGSISQTDADEAHQVGAEAARRCLDGESDVMVALQRQPGTDYATSLDVVPLVEVARQERRLPDAFIAASGTDVSEAFLGYARPLIGGPLPELWRF